MVVYKFQKNFYIHLKQLILVIVMNVHIKVYQSLT